MTTSQQPGMLGSAISTLSTLGRLVVNDPSMLLSILPTMSQYFRSIPKASVRSTDFSRHHFLVILKHSFYILHAGSDECSHTPDILSQMVELAPEISDCIILFYHVFVLENVALSPEDEQLREEIKEMLPAFLTSLVLIPVVCAVLKKQVGLVDCLTRVWLLIGTGTGSITITNMDNHLAVIKQLAPSMDDNSLGWSELGDAMRNCPTRLVALSTIQRVLSELHSTPINVKLINANLLMILESTRLAETMMQDFLAAHIVKWCCVVMKRLTSPKRVLSPHCEKDVAATIHTAVLIIFLVLQESHSWAVEALENGALECIFRSQSLLDYEEEVHSDNLSTSFYALVDELNKYTVHRSVLKAARRTIRQVLWKNLEDELDQDERVWRAWSAFKNVVDDRWESRDFLKEIYCSNPQCEMPSPKSQCTSCKGAYFCDRRCQKIAWKLGHKDLCSDLQKQQRETFNNKSFTLRDYDFFFAVAEGDISIHRPEINGLTSRFLRARRTQNVLPYPLVVDLDYTKVPRTVCITTADEFLDLEGCQVLIEQSKKNVRQIVHVRIPDGSAVMNFIGRLQD